MNKKNKLFTTCFALWFAVIGFFILYHALTIHKEVGALYYG